MPDPVTIAAVAAGFQYLKDAVGLLKDAKDLLPAGEKREKAQRLLTEAEKQIPAAEAQVARALGYELCRCTYPPQIMLESGQPPVARCPRCGAERVGGAPASDVEERTHARLDALKGALDADKGHQFKETYVTQYHSTLDQLEATGISMSDFRIEDDQLDYRVNGGNYLTGETTYSSDRYVDRPYFMSKVNAALKYLTGKKGRR